MSKTIEVNNGCSVELIPMHNSVIIHNRDENNCVYRIKSFSDGEIIMALNMLRYMRQEHISTAYLLDEIALKDLREHGDMDNVVDFTIFDCWR